MVDDFINRKNGLTQVQYLLPELEELTAETLGETVALKFLPEPRITSYNVCYTKLLRARAPGGR